MAYREVAMWEILDVLRRSQSGESNSAVARTTGRSRSTIRRYLAAAAELGWTLGSDAEPTEALAAEIGRQLNPARGRPAGEAEQVLLPHRDQIQAWLKPAVGEKRGLQLTKVHQLLGRRGVQVPYSSLHRFAVKHCGLADSSVTVRVAESEAGEVAEIDFGRLGLVWDPATERRRTLWALIVLLSFSRHQYVHTTFSQQVGDVIGGLEDAWLFFGGVTRRLVIDNFAAAVTKADRYDPIFQRVFNEYAAHRGFVLDPAPVRHPTGKPRVERGVPYVRENFFRGEEWRDRDHVQSSIVTWSLHTAGTRVHGTTRARGRAPAREGALRPSAVGGVQCASRPSHQLRQGTVLSADPLHWPEGVGARRLEARAGLQRRRTREDARAAADRWSRYGSQRLPAGAYVVHAARSAADHPPGTAARDTDRPLRRSAWTLLGLEGARGGDAQSVLASKHLLRGDFGTRGGVDREIRAFLLFPAKTLGDERVALR